MDQLLATEIPENRFETLDNFRYKAEIVNDCTSCVRCAKFDSGSLEQEPRVMMRGIIDRMVYCLPCWSGFKSCTSIPAIEHFSQLDLAYKKQIVNAVENQRRLWVPNQTPLWLEGMVQDQQSEISNVLSSVLFSLPTVLVNLIASFSTDDDPIVEKDHVYHCLDTVILRCHVQIIDIRGYFAHVRYLDWGERFDEWIEFYPVNTRFFPCDCPSSGRIKLGGDIR